MPDTMKKGLDLIPGDKAVVMLSGGPDSAACLAHANAFCEDGVVNVYVDFDQSMSEVEKKLVKKQSEYYDNDSIIFDVGEIAHQAHGIRDKVETEDKSDILGSEDLRYYPLRNIQMMLMGGKVADMVGADDLYVGLHSFGNTPDSSEDTLEPLSQSMDAASTTEGGFQIAMPFSGHGWEEGIAYGHDLGAPWHLTYSCYREPESLDDPKHCGKCYSCQQRKEKFEEAGVDDPIEYE